MAPILHRYLAVFEITHVKDNVYLCNQMWMAKELSYKGNSMDVICKITW